MEVSEEVVNDPETHDEENESEENDDDQKIEGVDIIEHCLCMNCGSGNGKTRM